MSLEQGLGLMDISRGRPGRKPGDERSSPPDYYVIIYKINPSPLGIRPVCLRVPSRGAYSPAPHPALSLLSEKIL